METINVSEIGYYRRGVKPTIVLVDGLPPNFLLRIFSSKRIILFGNS